MVIPDTVDIGYVVVEMKICHNVHVSVPQMEALQNTICCIKFYGDGDQVNEQLPVNILQLVFPIYKEKCGNSY